MKIIPLKPQYVQDLQAIGVWLMGRFAEMGMDPKMPGTVQATARLARDFQVGQLIILHRHPVIPFKELAAEKYPHASLDTPKDCNPNFVQHWEIYVVDKQHADLSKLPH
jgi:hypothetical protein